MAFLEYAAIGCSGMGRRHLHGKARLAKSGFDQLRLAAVCDLNQELAQAMADEAAELMGARPRVYTSIATMAAENPAIKAAVVATDAGSHKAVALQCFKAGLHVLCEKPLGITVAECSAIIDAAEAAGLVLSVAENFRRDPMNRLVKALIDDGAIGTPRLMMETCIGGGDLMVQTPWRHLKHTGTVILDSGVHNADIIRYYMGEVVSVFGEGRVHEKIRRTAPRLDGESAAKDKWWRASPQTPPQFEATGEDATYSQIRFRSGAIAHWVMDRAGQGEARDSRVIYGSHGSISAPGDRNGRPVTLHLKDGSRITGERILDYAPSYRLAPLAAHFFGGERPWRYELPFDDIDQSLLAMQLHELAECVLNGVQPEVTGEVARAAVALAYAPIESGRLARAVTISEVIAGAATPHQTEIDQIRSQPARAA